MDRYSFCRRTLKGKKPSIVTGGNALQTIDLTLLGGFIAKRRAERGETLKQASRKLGVVHQTLYKWEHGFQVPHLDFYCRIVSYLGYDPWEGANLSFGSRLKLGRLRCGLSRERLATKLRISVNAYERWEDDEISLVRINQRRKLEAFLREAAER